MFSKYSPLGALLVVPLMYVIVGGCGGMCDHCGLELALLGISQSSGNIARHTEHIQQTYGTHIQQTYGTYTADIMGHVQHYRHTGHCTADNSN